jgi:hypothetical protein
MADSSKMESGPLGVGLGGMGMGGYGSGRPRSPFARQLVERCLIVDINDLVKRGILRLGELDCGPLRLTGPLYSSRGTFWYDLKEDIELDLHHQHPEDRMESNTRRIRIARYPSAVGKLRLWFLCPVTGRRATKLYLPPLVGRFASREAHGLAYASQRK